MYITKKHISRRTVLRGTGAMLALPFLEAMVPARTALAQTAASPPPRFVGLFVPHGAGPGHWVPETAGPLGAELPFIWTPLEPFRDQLVILSGLHSRSAEPPPGVTGADHWVAAAFMCAEKPKKTAGADVRAGTTIDQVIAQKIGQETPIPSMQLCIENVDQAGGCFYGYSCAYTDSISWSSPTQPLPMVRDPRMVFDQLFGVGATPEARAARRRRDRSILDWVSGSVNRMKADLGAADRVRLTSYLDDVREIEQRIQRVEAFNSSGEQRELPEAPIGVPDSYAEHVKLMLDLQALAFTSDITRVGAFKMSRDVSNRVFTDAGVSTGFHIASHHQEREDRINDFAKINTWHVSLLPHLLDRLKDTPDGDGSVLDNTVILYGSPMGNPNVHNHKRCPLFLAGHAGGRLKGHLHHIAPDGLPMANVMLSVAQMFGVEADSFGDSNGTFDLNEVADTTVR
jgi:hypothetical protein